MRFSVVIPCHDRLKLLKEAIHTVLKQDWQEWEMVIFDNSSKEDFQDYVSSLQDTRITYNRSEKYLPVTESWNRAIEMASGEYIIFLGDDDGLTPHFFSRMARLIDRFSNPEVIYSALYQFMHPGVAPWAKAGYVAEVKNAFFFQNKTEPFFLSQTDVAKAVSGSIAFKRNFTFNIQAFTLSRDFLQRLKISGPIFQSPFPDYFLANIAIAKSRSTLIVPNPMCIAGVSKASVGYTLFNNLEDRFSELLNTNLTSDPFYQEIQQIVLPGSLYHSNYLLTMRYVVKHLSGWLNRKIDNRRYRRIQIYSSLYILGHQGKSVKELTYWSQLMISEKIWALLCLLLIKASEKNWFFSKTLKFYHNKRISPHAFECLTRYCNKKSYVDLVSVFNDLESKMLI